MHDNATTENIITCQYCDDVIDKDNVVCIKERACKQC